MGGQEALSLPGGGARRGSEHYVLQEASWHSKRAEEGPLEEIMQGPFRALQVGEPEGGTAGTQRPHMAPPTWKASKRGGAPCTASSSHTPTKQTK